MNCKDLRIGNLVEIDYGLICPVTLMAEDYVMLGELKRSIDVVNPIPLTEEWLLKFGINAHNLENGYYNGTCVGYYPKSDGWFFVVDSYDDGYGGLNYTTKEIKYVHELQNLYFFWNDKELELK